MGIIKSIFGPSKGAGRILSDIALIERENPVKEAVELIKSTVINENIEALDEAIEKQRALIAGLFGIEEDAREAAVKNLNSIARRRNVITKMEKFAGRYTPISHDVLQWRDYRGYPKLLPFNLNTPEFVIGSRSYLIRMG